MSQLSFVLTWLPALPVKSPMSTPGARSDLTVECDVSSDQQIDQVFSTLAERWDGIDGIVHSVAFAPREALNGGYLEAVTRQNFIEAHDISSYSFAALAKAGKDMMSGRKAALLTMTYLGAERVIPNYNVMGVAKASLEANVRYMAGSLATPMTL